MTQAVESRAYQRRDGLWVFPRAEFASERFDYSPGEHVVFGGPTQRGKTSLAFELLQYCATPDLPAYVAVSKPKDPTTAKWADKLNYVVVRDWPAPRKIGNWNPSGYVIWPVYGSLSGDLTRASDITRRLLNDRYAAGMRDKHAILVMDDTMLKAKLMGLDSDMTAILAMSGAMGIGEWVFVQKPTGSGSTAIWGYGASEHVFLARDPDQQNRIRYNEIGGFDSKLVDKVSNSLQPYQFLYLRRTGAHICIVDAA